MPEIGIGQTLRSPTGPPTVPNVTLENCDFNVSSGNPLGYRRSPINLATGEYNILGKLAVRHHSANKVLQTFSWELFLEKDKLDSMIALFTTQQILIGDNNTGTTADAAITLEDYRLTIIDDGTRTTASSPPVGSPTISNPTIGSFTEKWAEFRILVTNYSFEYVFGDFYTLTFEAQET